MDEPPSAASGCLAYRFGVPWPSSLARAIITRCLFLLHCLYGFGDGVQPCLTKVHI
jgi:hypothetical protein